MSRVKWMLAVVALVLGSSPMWACDGGAAPIAPVSSPFETQIVPAVLHLPGPDEEPLYTSIQFVKAPPILPGNRCEAQCLADFRKCEADCRNVLDLCAADCTDGV
ncbi:MAG: hypothetical protein ACJ76J_22490 [Thermoanaerobaculia bacterium]